MTERRDPFGAGRPPGRVFALADTVRVLCSRMQQYADRAGHRIGLSRSDLIALNLISQANRQGHRLSPSEVAHRMSLSPAAMTALVDRLERVGHLERHPDEEDRRRVRLGVSEQAVRVSIQMFAPLTEQMERAVTGFTDEELDTATRVLRVLAEMAEHTDPGGADFTGTPYAPDGARPARSAGRGTAAPPTLGAHETG